MNTRIFVLHSFFLTRTHACFFIHAVAHVFFTCGWLKLFLHAGAMENGPGDIKTEIVTKVAPLRAVDLSIGPFCIEFRCNFVTTTFFGIGVNFWPSGWVVAFFYMRWPLFFLQHAVAHVF